MSTDTAQTEDVAAIMKELGERARDAASVLSTATTEQKNRALKAAATAIRKNAKSLMEANKKDMAAAEQRDLSSAMLDRLMLDEARVKSMAKGLEEVAELDDPVGQVLDAWERPNGLKIERVRVPLGVIGIIYESRPNVTADAGGLCLKSGNAAILRGGSESFHSSHAILECLQAGLREANLPEAAIQMVPTTDRAAVGELLTMTKYVDVIVPRGGKSLIERVMNESKIPLFMHLEGICHTYIHKDADQKKALEITLNAKMRRPGICGATETVLVDEAVAQQTIPALVDVLASAGCEIRGDDAVRKLDDRVVPASDEDWDTEYLEKVVAVKLVKDKDEAIHHINTHGSEHTDSIITEDTETAEYFLDHVHSAICMVNASTQFADGGEFGMGAEIGISTGKMHARGPVGVEQLTTFKYKVRGTGQVRP